MIEQISPKVQDFGIKNNEGKPITGDATLLLSPFFSKACLDAIIRRDPLD
jgi:hypothetical protein